MTNARYFKVEFQCDDAGALVCSDFAKARSMKDATAWRNGKPARYRRARNLKGADTCLVLRAVYVLNGSARIPDSGWPRTRLDAVKAAGGGMIDTREFASLKLRATTLRDWHAKHTDTADQAEKLRPMEALEYEIHDR